MRGDPDLQAGLTRQVIAAAYWGDTTLTDPAWRKAWDACPRDRFAPDTWYVWADGAWQARHRADYPHSWQAAVHDPDNPMVTQVDGDWATCSLSAPVTVAAMLGGLDVSDGMRVLESGTGMGWTAGLLSARLGEQNVVSIEFDGGLLLTAGERLAAAGYRPTLICGDGTAGCPDLAPFDRVAATHAVTAVPPAWIAQTRPGGLVCTPVRVSAGFDVYVQLTVAGDGAACGPVVCPVAFMGSRAAPQPSRAALLHTPEVVGATILDMPAVLAARHEMVLQLAIPGLTVRGWEVEHGDECVWLYGPDGSWAVGYVPEGAPWDQAVVEQYGPRRVWSEAEEAFARWEAAGRPDLSRYGLTVAADGVHTLWMDDPSNVVSTLPVEV